MNAINANSSNGYIPSTLSVLASAGAADQVKSQQAQQQKAQATELAKPVIDQVVISKQAQELLNTDAGNPQNAAGRVDRSNSLTNDSLVNGTTNNNIGNSNLNNQQLLDTPKPVANRQTAAALVEYAQQQGNASPPKVDPRIEAEPTTSIKALA